jgi:hypothetical protein
MVMMCFKVIYLYLYEGAPEKQDSMSSRCESNSGQQRRGLVTTQLRRSITLTLWTGCFPSSLMLSINYVRYEMVTIKWWTREHLEVGGHALFQGIICGMYVETGGKRKYTQWEKLAARRKLRTPTPQIHVQASSITNALTCLINWRTFKRMNIKAETTRFLATAPPQAFLLWTNQNKQKKTPCF